MWKASPFFFVLNKSTFEFEQYFLDMFKRIMFMFVILSVEKSNIRTASKVVQVKNRHLISLKN